jgi:hypothetical protein
LAIYQIFVNVDTWLPKTPSTVGRFLHLAELDTLLAMTLG